MDGMVDVRSRKCRIEGCDKQSSLGVAGTKTMEYCAQHAPGGMVNVTKNGTFANAEEYMRRKVDPHHSEEEVVVNICPSGTMQALLRTVAKIPISDHDAQTLNQKKKG